MAAHSQLAGLVIVVLLVWVNGQTPKRCCVSKQWSAVMTNLSSINSQAFTITNLQYDFTTLKEAAVMMTFDPVTQVTNVTGRTVIDFGKNVLYYLPQNEPSKCYKVPYVMDAVQCVPESATYLGSTYLGPMGGRLPYDGWRFQMGNSSIVVTLALSKDGCVPLMEGLSTPGKPESDQLLLFTDFQPRLSDPDQFNIPASCPK